MNQRHRDPRQGPGELLRPEDVAVSPRAAPRLLFVGRAGANQRFGCGGTRRSSWRCSRTCRTLGVAAWMPHGRSSRFALKPFWLKRLRNGKGIVEDETSTNESVVNVKSPESDGYHEVPRQSPCRWILSEAQIVLG
jgi:hypothetical protein